MFYRIISSTSCTRGDITLAFPGRKTHKFPEYMLIMIIVYICPPAVIELSCNEYGPDKIRLMVDSMGNGECMDWFHDPSRILKLEQLRTQYPLSRNGSADSGQLEATSALNQLNILLQRGYLKGKRDTTLTYLR